MEMVVVAAMVVVVFAIVLPAVGTARRSAAKTACQTNIRHVGDAALDYSRANRNRMVPDLRWPAWRLGPDGSRQQRANAWNTQPPYDPAVRKQSWLGQLDPYLGEYRRRLDCPLVNDHRKGGYNSDEDHYVWDTDYVINRFGLNTPVDVADEPSRAVLFGEPNMPRTTVSYLPEIIAWSTWWAYNPDVRADLEQLVAGSVSFGFVDGHAVRVTVPEVNIPFVAAYPELALSAGSPPTGSHIAMFNNYLWWRSSQVENPLLNPRPHYPAHNDSILR